MLELSESFTIAKQMNKSIRGKRIIAVKANHSPHKFTWYHENPEKYESFLKGKIIGRAHGMGGMVELEIEDYRMVFCDGAIPIYYKRTEKLPMDHQLFMEFEDETLLICKVQMYGGIWVFRENEFSNGYYLVTKEKPSPLTEDFDFSYFKSLRNEKTEKLSAKAFLATEQRIPGLGNGSLQDILLMAGIHPKRKMSTLTNREYKILFAALKTTLEQMTMAGGRDTEKDFYGKNGGYTTILSKKTIGKPCPFCGDTIQKTNYLGGSVYFCNRCQYENGKYRGIESL